LGENHNFLKAYSGSFLLNFFKHTHQHFKEENIEPQAPILICNKEYKVPKYVT